MQASRDLKEADASCLNAMMPFLLGAGWASTMRHCMAPPSFFVPGVEKLWLHASDCEVWPCIRCLSWRREDSREPLGHVQLAFPKATRVPAISRKMVENSDGRFGSPRDMPVDAVEKWLLSPGEVAVPLVNNVSDVPTLNYLPW